MGMLVGINIHMWVIRVTQRDVGDRHVQRSGFGSDTRFLLSCHLRDGSKVSMVALRIEPALLEYLLLHKISLNRWPVVLLKTEWPKIPVDHLLNLTVVFIIDLNRHLGSSIFDLAKLRSHKWNSLSDS